MPVPDINPHQNTVERITQRMAQRERDLAYCSGLLEAVVALLSAVSRRSELIERLRHHHGTTEEELHRAMATVMALYSDVGHVAAYLPPLRRVVECLRTGTLPPVEPVPDIPDSRLQAILRRARGGPNAEREVSEEEAQDLRSLDEERDVEDAVPDEEET